MPLVEIPTNETLDGFSPELKVRQRIDARALPRLQAFADAFHARFGRPLVVTEGARSRTRQQYLWDHRRELGIVVAPPFTSKHDEVLRGNAVDLGSGIATLTTERAHWAHTNGTRLGVRPSGLTFNPPESWHFDIDTSSYAGDIGTPIGDDMSELAEQQIASIYNALFPKGVPYNNIDVIKSNVQPVYDALIKPNTTSGQFRPIDVILTHVKAIYAEVITNNGDSITDAQLNTLAAKTAALVPPAPTITEAQIVAIADAVHVDASAIAAALEAALRDDFDNLPTAAENARAVRENLIRPANL